MFTLTFSLEELRAIAWAIDSNRQECDGSKVEEKIKAVAGELA